MDWRSAWSNVHIVIINVNSSYYKAFFAVYATTIKKIECFANIYYNRMERCD